MSTTRFRSPTEKGYIGRIEAAKDGAAWAWESLYAEYAGYVNGYLRRRGAADPDDLTAEVFFQVARDIHRFEGDEATFRSWLFVIAHRRLVDDRRSQARKLDTVDEDSRQLDTEGGDVEREVMEQLAQSWVEDLLAKLTEDQRHVLALRIIADLTLEETAQVLNKRVTAVKALQRRALQSLQRMVAEEGQWI
jgi:RNA polymerase sigma factor (sigma-70 family)